MDNFARMSQRKEKCGRKSTTKRVVESAPSQRTLSGTVHLFGRRLLDQLSPAAVLFAAVPGRVGRIGRLNSGDFGPKVETIEIHFRCQSRTAACRRCCSSCVVLVLVVVARFAQRLADKFGDRCRRGEPGNGRGQTNGNQDFMV